MTTYTQARDELITRVNTTLNASYPTLPVFYENTRSVDYNTVGSQFLQVAIDFDNAKMATMNDAPTDLIIGRVCFRHWVREGGGSRATNQVFDTLNVALRHNTTNGVTTTTPNFGVTRNLKEWLISELFIPFKFYSA